jgi:acylphosphatase
MQENAKRGVRAVYTGRVQGVGFRVNVLELARNFPVVGEVRNVADGSVELIAVGEDRPIMDFLKAVDDRFSRNIVDCRMDWMDGTGSFYTDFSIGADCGDEL